MALLVTPALTAILSTPRHVPYNLLVAGVTDIGQVRARNEDSLALAPELGIAVVADGMGGHPGGDVASRTAAEEAVSHLSRRPALPTTADAEDIAAYLGQRAESAVMEAHEAIRRKQSEDAELSGMGTTLTAFSADHASGVFAIGHVGDSRAYRFRSGTLLQLTRDDTWVQERVEAEELTPEQAKRHPFGHILTQCVGLEDPPEPQVITGQAREGDLYLLCSDGLMGMVTPEELPALLTRREADTLESIAQRLVDTAKERGGFDNITVALVAVTEG